MPKSTLHYFLTFFLAQQLKITSNFKIFKITKNKTPRSEYNKKYKSQFQKHLNKSPS